MSKTFSSGFSSFLGSIIGAGAGSTGFSSSTFASAAGLDSRSILPKTLASPMAGALALITSGFLGSISSFSSGTLVITTS